MTLLRLRVFEAHLDSARVGCCYKIAAWYRSSRVDNWTCVNLVVKDARFGTLMLSVSKPTNLYCLLLLDTVARHPRSSRPQFLPRYVVCLFVCLLVFSPFLACPCPRYARVHLPPNTVASRDALLPVCSPNLSPHAPTLVPWRSGRQGWGWAGGVFVRCWQARFCRCQSSPRT